MSSHERLQALEEELQASGADQTRLELVRRARIFKRSWVDMADALIKVRKAGAFRKWGYDDFHDYCQSELLLTKVTVDKLTGSYQAVVEHAPQVLQRDGLAKPIPTVEAVDYFAKALKQLDPMNDTEEEEPEEDPLEDLKHAVFEDNKSVAVLRRQFNPVFFSKSDGQQKVESLEKTRAAARRLEGLLARGLEQELGLDETAALTLVKKLAALREELDVLLPKAKAALEHEERQAS